MGSGCPSTNRILGAWPLPITFRRHFFGREVLLDLLSASGVRWLWEKGKGRSEKGKERGSAARPFRAQLAQRFGKISARKPRYLMTRASFRRVIAGCFSVAGRIPRSAYRPIRGRPAARAFPRGIPRFSCQDLPRRLYCFGLLTTAFAQQACPRAGMLSPLYRGGRPIVGGSHSQRRSRTLGERSKCVQEAILAGFPHRAENRTRT